MASFKAMMASVFEGRNYDEIVGRGVHAGTFGGEEDRGGQGLDGLAGCLDG
ncbi:hypothetical protein BJG92_01383 [Arthrobacter sp. SO5]|uniref:hypothetical protein n=1 Tax=Arthrobacter sp. SO5 TaxID=1897055 RepID=UPI001E2EBEF2|nr:hypothetical protein [Arthrobacter sp. SO5]MCB5273858.1 hypothetical protein [Arthrobacter sp. SO5]